MLQQPSWIPTCPAPTCWSLGPREPRTHLNRPRSPLSHSTSGFDRYHGVCTKCGARGSELNQLSLDLVVDSVSHAFLT